MQNKEKNVRFGKVDRDTYTRLVAKLTSMFNCEKISLEVERLYILNNEYSTYCYYEGDVDSLRQILYKIESVLMLHPYCVGTPILMERQDGDLIPLIPLEKYLKTCKNKIVVKGKLAEKLTYGKIIEINEKNKSLNTSFIMQSNSRKILYMIYNESDIFLGFARIEYVDKDRVKIIPVRDIGWYLRKGG